MRIGGNIRANTHPDGTMVGERDASNPFVPETPALAAKALAQLKAEEQRVTSAIAKIDDAKREISGLLDAVFERIQHSPIKSKTLIVLSFNSISTESNILQNMRIFLDTEFTQLNLANAKLISLGLVVEKTLEEFYIEVSPLPPIGECSEFVREIVLPLLGHYPGAACPQDEMRSRIINWLQLVRHYDDELFIHFDSEFDEHMIRAALNPVPAWVRIARISSRDTSELLRFEYHTSDKSGRPEHHALYDAHALAYSYRPRSAISGFVNPLAL